MRYHGHSYSAQGCATFEGCTSLPVMPFSPQTIMAAYHSKLRMSQIISRYYKSIENCKTISVIVDRLYVYDNSVENQDAKPLFRLINGYIGKIYTTNIPEWAQYILPDNGNLR